MPPMFDGRVPNAIEFDGVDVRGMNGGRIYSTAPQLLDHFIYGAGALSTANPQLWVTTETGAATPFAPSATVEGGAIACICGAITNNSEEVAGKLVGWKPSTMGAGTKLVLEVRAKFLGSGTPLNGDFVIGFSNAVTHASGLPYVVGLSSLYTTSAPVEFAGFHYSSIPTSGALFLAGGNPIGIITEKASVAALALSTGKVKDSNMRTYRVEIDTAGTATFFYEGVQVGGVGLAVTPTVALTPYVAAITKASDSHRGTIDYILVGGQLV